MINLKKLFTVLFFCTVTLMQAYSQILEVDLMNGNLEYFELENLKSTKYSSSTMDLILNDGNSASWNINAVKSLKFIEEIPSGINSSNIFSLEKAITIFPNPTEEKLNIDFILSESYLESLKISIVDINGRLIFESNSENNQNNFEINIKDLETGIYTIVFKNKIVSFSKKIIKQ